MSCSVYFNRVRGDDFGLDLVQDVIIHARCASVIVYNSRRLQAAVRSTTQAASTAVNSDRTGLFQQLTWLMIDAAT